MNGIQSLFKKGVPAVQCGRVVGASGVDGGMMSVGGLASGTPMDATAFPQGTPVGASVAMVCASGDPQMRYPIGQIPWNSPGV